MKFLAWVGQTRENFTGKNTSSKLFPYSFRGQLNAIKAVYKMRVKHPNWEWGIWSADDSGNVTSPLVFMDASAFAALKRDSLHELSRLRVLRIGR